MKNFSWIDSNQNLAMTREELRALIADLGITQARAAFIGGIKKRAIEFMLSGGRKVDERTARLLLAQKELKRMLK